MMDEFDKKRGMVKVLMDVLKKSAGDEVAGGLKKHDQLTHTPLPEGSVADHPHKKEDYKPGAMKGGDQMPMEGEKPSMASQVMPGMAEGGMASPSDEPEREMSAIGEDSAPSPVAPERGEDAEANEDMDIEENDTEDTNDDVSPFSGVMNKKKKK